MHDTSLLVSARDAAKLLACSERTLWSLTFEAAELPHVRVRRRVLYAIADLQTWVAANRTTGRGIPPPQGS